MVKEILTLPETLDSAEPQTQEEIDAWVRKAQAVRIRMVELEARGREFRVDTIRYLETLNGADYTLKDPLIEFFEAENAYFRLAQDSSKNSTVRVFNSTSPSEEDRQSFKALAELGESLLASYQRVLDSQSRLLAAAKEQGLDFRPVWDPTEQKETLDSYRAMKAMAERFKGN